MRTEFVKVHIYGGNAVFDYFISLGSACPVAFSMSKYGLRSYSSPFDWLITPDFSWVLYHIETGFKNFLLQENLEMYDENPNHFRDKQSDIRFIHDNESFINEYGALKRKYSRRIDKFQEISKKKVCYLRRMVSEKEIKYVETHVDYIQNIIHKHNPDSEIVFLCDGTLTIPENFVFNYFRMKEKYSGTSRKSLRAYFDHANDFLTFCGENYSGINLIKNLMFDIEKESVEQQLTERRYKTLTTLITYDFRKDVFPDAVIIYGAGVIGTELYKRIKNYTKVRCFVDKNKSGGEFDNVKIISVDDLRYENRTKIIVSAAYDFENIKSKLCDKYSNEDIISLDDILNLKF